MIRKLGISLITLLISTNLVFADDRQGYALDKLANAQAQLDRLEAQKDALEELIKAVKKDLRAAKIRAKAERIQLQADTKRQDAAVMVEQSGVAVDLPNLMNTKNAQGQVVEYNAQKDEVDLMFKDKNQEQKTVFFPGGDEGKKIEPNYDGIENDSDFKYIK